MCGRGDKVATGVEDGAGEVEPRLKRLLRISIMTESAAMVAGRAPELAGGSSRTAVSDLARCEPRPRGQPGVVTRRASVIVVNAVTVGPSISR